VRLGCATAQAKRRRSKCLGNKTVQFRPVAVHVLPCARIAMCTYCPVHALPCALTALCTYCPVQALPCARIALCTYCPVHAFPSNGLTQFSFPCHDFRTRDICPSHRVDTLLWNQLDICAFYEAFLSKYQTLREGNTTCEYQCEGKGESKSRP
jgi:hypothetical protein